MRVIVLIMAEKSYYQHLIMGVNKGIRKRNLESLAIARKKGET